MLSCLSRVRLFVTPWTVAHQAPLSMGFSRQEYWCGLPCSPPGDLPHPRIEPVPLVSPALAGGFFTIQPHGKLQISFLPELKLRDFSSQKRQHKGTAVIKSTEGAAFIPQA